MIVILFSALLFIFIFILWKMFCFPRESIPIARKALPIFGHIWIGFVKKERFYEIMQETILAPSLRKAENLVYFKLATWKVYVCLDPEDGYLVVNACLKKDALYKFFSPVFGGPDGLINADAPVWKVHRKLLNPTMNQSVLDTYLTEFDTHSRQLVEMLDQQVGEGPFDPLFYLKQAVLQSVCATMMGVSVEDDKPLIEEFGKISDTFTSYIVERSRKFYYHSDFLFNMSRLKKKQDDASVNLQKLTNKVINERRAKIAMLEDKVTNAPTFQSFLDFLLEMEKSGVLSEAEVRQEVNTFLGAAFDTTYQGLGVMLLVIGSYPAVQQKIADELEEVFGGSDRIVDRQDLSRLKYLEATMKETMRLYPVVVGLGRTLDKDLKLKRHTLRAGSRCFVSIYHVGRHAVWGADAEQFRPERWLDGSLPREAGAFAVFGLGRRSCIGSNFAMMLMKTVLCHVVRAYRISGDVTRLVRMLDIVTTPASGHHISLQRRH